MALPQEVLDTFPDELKSEPSLVDFNDIPSLAKSFVETKKMNGTMVRIPTGEDDDEAVERFYTKVRPESADKYEVKRPDLNPGVEWNDELEKSYLTHAHKNGMTQRQMQQSINWWMETMGNVSSTHALTIEQGEAGLKKVWGGDYAKNKESMARGYQDLARVDPGLKDFLEATGMGNHPSMANIIRQHGENLAEDKGGLPGLNADQVLMAKEKIAAVRSDNCGGKPEAERCAFHRNDKHATAEMNKFYEIAFPNG